MRIIENLRNTLLKKGNDFYHPKLTLSTGYVLEAGICSLKWMRDLHHKNKNKLIRNVRMNRNAAYIENVSKQKANPVLSLFDINLTTALKDEYGEAAKGTWDFLKLFNDCIAQPLLNVSTSKGVKIKEASIFIFAKDILLKFFIK